MRSIRTSPLQHAGTASAAHAGLAGEWQVKPGGKPGVEHRLALERHLQLARLAMLDQPHFSTRDIRRRDLARAGLRQWCAEAFDVDACAFDPGGDERGFGRVLRAG